MGWAGWSRTPSPLPPVLDAIADHLYHRPAPQPGYGLHSSGTPLVAVQLSEHAGHLEAHAAAEIRGIRQEQQPVQTFGQGVTAGVHAGDSGSGIMFRARATRVSRSRRTVSARTALVPASVSAK